MFVSVDVATENYPLILFYVDKRTLAPDNYCKECRRAMSNARYRRSLPASNPLRYPVITEISDCTLRMYLILNALKVVREACSASGNAYAKQVI